MGVSLSLRWPLTPICEPSRLNNTCILSPGTPIASLPVPILPHPLSLSSSHPCDSNPRCFPSIQNQQLWDEAFSFFFFRFLKHRNTYFLFLVLDCREILKNIGAVIIYNPSIPSNLSASSTVAIQPKSRLNPAGSC